MNGRKPQNNSSDTAANYSGKDFSGKNISGANFAGANLTGAKLVKVKVDAQTDFTRANLTSATIDRTVLTAKVTGAKLKAARVLGRDLTELDLREVDFEEAVLTFCDFSGSNLTGVSFKKAALMQAELARLDLSNVQFDHASLCCADVSYSDMTTTNLLNAQVSGGSVATQANFCGAIMIGNLNMYDDVIRIAKAQHAIFNVDDFVAAVKNDYINTNTGNLPSFYFKNICVALLREKINHLPEGDKADAIRSLISQIKDSDGDVKSIISVIQAWKYQETNGEFNLEIIKKHRHTLHGLHTDTDNLIEKMLFGLMEFARKYVIDVGEEKSPYYQFKLILDDLNEQIAEYGKHDQSNHFHTSLSKLHHDLIADIQAQISKKVPYNKIVTSPAMKVVLKTTQLLTTLSKDNSPDDKLTAIETYENQFKNTSRFGNFLKAIAVVIIAAVGCVLGAGVGCAIGLAAGIWTGYGALATATIAAVKGAVTGATAGVAAGAAVTGIAAGAVGGYLLFKPNKTASMVKSVAEEAGKYVNSRRA